MRSLEYTKEKYAIGLSSACKLYLGRNRIHENEHINVKQLMCSVILYNNGSWMDVLPYVNLWGRSP